MIRTLLLALVLIPASAWAVDNVLTADEKSAGWILLFDGTSTAGWVEVTGKPFPTGSWKIEDHSLRAFTGKDGMQDIRTTARFRHFELRFEWKLADRGNSGVKYFVQRVDEWTNAQGRQARGRGFEFQLAVDGTPEAASDPTRSCAALYSVLAPSSNTAPRTGAFNQSRIVVDAVHVEHWLNGARVLSFNRNDPAVEKLLHSLARSNAASDDTFIVLQNHASDVWFRNLKIRPLD